MIIKTNAGKKHTLMKHNSMIKLWSSFLGMTMMLFIFSCSGTKNLVSEYSGVDNALLWKIEGQDLKNPSYLYGTIHMIEDQDYFLPDGTLGAIDQSDRLVFEIDMQEMSDPSAAMGLLQNAFMSDNKSLKDLVSESEYKMINEHFSKMGLPLFLFERIKPMFLTVFASSDFDPNGMQNGSLKSYEMEFMEIATRTGKPSGGLESIEFQMSIFDSIPYEDQAKMLVESLENSDLGSDTFKQMVAVYKKQDLNAMITMISEDEDGIGEYEDMMLNQRNEKWIPLMEDMMRKEVVFFAVGAGHLAGERGVIHLLRKAGYKMTPISNKKPQ